MDEESKKEKIMNFIYTALENGWEVRKTETKTYIFKKKHHNEKEIFMDNYLEHFISSNFSNISDAIVLE